MNDLIYEV